MLWFMLTLVWGSELGGQSLGQPLQATDWTCAAQTCVRRGRYDKLSGVWLATLSEDALVEQVSFSSYWVPLRTSISVSEDATPSAHPWQDGERAYKALVSDLQEHGWSVDQQAIGSERATVLTHRNQQRTVALWQTELAAEDGGTTPFGVTHLLVQTAVPSGWPEGANSWGEAR